jgi:hypothetical protein
VPVTVQYLWLIVGGCVVGLLDSYSISSYSTSRVVVYVAVIVFDESHHHHHNHLRPTRHNFARRQQFKTYTVSFRFYCFADGS